MPSQRIDELIKSFEKNGVKMDTIKEYDTQSQSPSVPTKPAKEVLNEVKLDDRWKDETPAPKDSVVARHLNEKTNSEVKGLGRELSDKGIEAKSQNDIER